MGAANVSTFLIGHGKSAMRLLDIEHDGTIEHAQEAWRANVAADRGRYPLDSAVEKAMLSFIYRGWRLEMHTAAGSWR